MDHAIKVIIIFAVISNATNANSDSIIITVLLVFAMSVAVYIYLQIAKISANEWLQWMWHGVDLPTAVC